jgi:sporulation protein YlmC with PRC-barrel domain
MEIEYGANVFDKNGATLGTVNYIMRNTWTGEISKFMVKNQQNGKNIFFKPDEVIEATKSEIKVSSSGEDLTIKHINELGK